MSSQMSNNYLLNTAKHGTHNIIANVLKENQLVLDVGCNDGYLKKLSNKNTFVGIDIFEDNIRNAKDAGYKDAFKIDLNGYEKFSYPEKFDAIVFADVLEHLNDPKAVLAFFVNNYLKENGTTIISLPNVAHFSTRLNLLFGKFDYTESGILDKTHFHLYTLKTARELVTSCGLKILAEKFSSNRFGKLIELFPILATLFGFNIILVCTKKA